MYRNRTVASLDVHKDSVYLRIMGHDGVIIFEKTYGVLTPDRAQPTGWGWQYRYRAKKSPGQFD